MSLRYKLFGIPADINEVANRAKRTQEMPEVYVTRKSVPELVPGAQEFKYSVKVRIGRSNISVYTWNRTFENFVLDIRSDFCIANQASRETAQFFAEEFSRSNKIPVLCGYEIYTSSQ